MHDDPLRDLPSEIPRLNPLPFVIADVVLVGTAAFIGWAAPTPIGVGHVAAIAGLVGLGAIAGLYPFVMNHARRQEESLQERANQIEALARTVGASAEQISIAVSNLPAIADNSARQLRVAEQLPAAVKAQIEALQHQLSATASEENAALRHELDTLRAAQTDKLAAALEGLSRAGADLARLESLMARHASALDGAVAQLPRLADVFREQSSEALRRETAAAVTALQHAVAESGAALADATNDARTAFERGVRDAVAHLAAQALSNPPFPAHARNQTGAQAAKPAEDAHAHVHADADAEAPATSAPSPVSTTAAVPLPAPAPMPPPALSTAPVPVSSLMPAPASKTAPTPDAVAVVRSNDDPAPVVVAPVVTPPASPVAIDDSGLDEPATPAPTTTPTPARSAASSAAPAAPAEGAASASPKAAVTDAETEDEPGLGLSLDDSAGTMAAAPAEAALSHDGFTRLVATAYIGIGNKLFIRGEGPGLRRDKGVPLQFVSIGKWRWESAELLFPAKVRLYKNDQVECAALGEITLEPGHHHEVAAQF